MSGTEGTRSKSYRESIPGAAKSDGAKQDHARAGSTDVLLPPVEKVAECGDSKAYIWEENYWWPRVKDKNGVVIHPLDRWVTGLISAIEKTSYIWATPIIKLAQGSAIDETALPPIPALDEASLMAEAVESEWLNQVKKKGGKNASLAWCFYKAFTFRFWKTFLFMGLEAAVQVLQAVVVGKLVGVVTDEESATVVYSWAAGLTIISYAYGPILHHQAFMHGWRFASACMNVTLSIVYRKSLRISQQGLGHVSAGHVTNLVTNDSERFMLGCIFVYFIVLAPLQLLAALWLLWMQVGWPAVFGPALLVLLAPLYRYLGKLLKKLRLETATITDERVKKMSEFIMGMRVIKMNAWESPLHKLITKIRNSELVLIRKTNYIRAFSLSLYFVTPVLAAYVVLMPYSLNGNMLTNETVFFCIAIFNAIRFPVSMCLPNSIQAISELSVVFQRLKEFLLLEEVKQVTVLPLEDQLSDHGQKIHIDFNQMSCSWNTSAADPELQLKDITMQIHRGELIMVVGPVGSGKSSLLMSILGELQPSSGSIRVAESLTGYSAQDPWIMNQTVRENITFGAEFNFDHFSKVIECCQLQVDLDSLPEGDMTVLGERGVNLSGGQRARIGLARAIYHQPELILLDDPLSAVDAKVGHNIFEECICKHLGGSTRILVTHQIQHAEFVDKILVLSEAGEIQAFGTFTEVTQMGINLQGFSYEDPEPVNPTSEPSPNLVEDIETTARLEKSKRRRSSVVAETSTSGKISLSTYISYFKNAGGTFFTIVLVGLFLITQALEMVASFYLKEWASKSFDEQQEDRWVVWYSILVGASLAVAFGRSFLFMHGCMRASAGLYAHVVSSVLRFPILFFDTNPTGRILNRFSKDTGYIDDLVPVTFLDFFGAALLCASNAIIASIINPYVFIISAPLTLIFFWLRAYYIRASREIKRLEAVLRSPKYSLLSSTLNGLATIRSRQGATEDLTHQMHELQNQHHGAFMMFMVGSRWLGYRLDMIGFFFIGAVTFIGIANREELGGGSIGLSLVYIMALSALFQWMVRQSAEIENQMTSVERMLEYSALPTEQMDRDMIDDSKGPDNWPSEGKIEFQEYSLSYSPDDEAALKSLSVDIQAHEKVGIVGRTGAGKSSLLAALFRLSHTQGGKILIDGKDIADVPLKVLRSSLSVIPQEPVLFSGTIRLNVDPFGLYSDDKIWSVLEDVQLKNALVDGLDTKVTENGKNYSVGQRQLICMARAMLQKNKILLLDEATANIDGETDQLIQKIIRTKFTDWTVLTIAHRLNTVIDSDKIAVLDSGRLIDFDSPAALLQKESGLLAELASYSRRSSAALKPPNPM